MFIYMCIYIHWPEQHHFRGLSKEFLAKALNSFDTQVVVVYDENLRCPRAVAVSEALGGLLGAIVAAAAAPNRGTRASFPGEKAFFFFFFLGSGCRAPPAKGVGGFHWKPPFGAANYTSGASRARVPVVTPIDWRQGTKSEGMPYHVTLGHPGWWIDTVLLEVCLCWRLFWFWLSLLF